MTIWLSTLAVGCSVAAVILLWVAWRRRARHRLPLLASCACWAGALAAWTAAFGAEIGIPLALECAAIVALSFILLRVEVRQARPMRARAVPPPDRPRGHWWRGSVRTLAAGPLGLAASLGIGVVFATGAPFADATRLIVAGLLVPSLWGAAMIWSLASRRTWPPAAGLVAVAATTIGLSLALAR